MGCYNIGVVGVRRSSESIFLDGREGGRNKVGTEDLENKGNKNQYRGFRKFLVKCSHPHDTFDFVVVVIFGLKIYEP